MARTILRPDVTAARSRAGISWGNGRELTALQNMLAGDEKVAAIVLCRYQGCVCLAAVTSERLIVVSDGIIWKVSDEVQLDAIRFVQWQTVFGIGSLTVHAGGRPLEITGMRGPAGKAITDRIREHLIGKARLERQARDGLVALTAHFAPEPVPAAEPADHFRAADHGLVLPAAGPRGW